MKSIDNADSRWPTYCYYAMLYSWKHLFIVQDSVIIQPHPRRVKTLSLLSNSRAVPPPYRSCGFSLIDWQRVIGPPVVLKILASEQLGIKVRNLNFWNYLYKIGHRAHWVYPRFFSSAVRSATIFFTFKRHQVSYACWVILLFSFLINKRPVTLLHCPWK